MTDIAGEVVLDACLLDPPEPLIQAMKVLQQMQPRQFLHMIHRREPRLLYAELAPLGFNSYTHKSDPHLFHILIWSQKDHVARARAQQLIHQLTSYTS